MSFRDRAAAWGTAAVVVLGIGIVTTVLVTRSQPAARPSPVPAPGVAEHARVIDAMPPPPCDRAAIERELAQITERKLAFMPRLFGAKRATPGAMFDRLALGAPVVDGADREIEDTLRDLGMTWRLRVDAGKLVGFGIEVGRYDPTYPGTCDPAGPCDCIGPGDERHLCSELKAQLDNAWGRSLRPRTQMFGFVAGDDAVWVGANGQRATLTTSCELVFSRGVIDVR